VIDSTGIAADSMLGTADDAFALLAADFSLFHRMAAPWRNDIEVFSIDAKSCNLRTVVSALMVAHSARSDDFMRFIPGRFLINRLMVLRRTF
jgi:hypothetical protein